MKKVLLITYYWPPAGGPGVQRWLKFVTHLPSFGIQPVLYIPENPEYPLIDETLLEELPKGITVYRGKIREPLRWARIFSGGSTRKMSTGQLPGKKAGIKARLLMWLRANLLVPDARVFWVKPSIKRVNDILEAEDIDTVITTGPPHSVHLIGMGIKKLTPVKWIADFRDPWTNISYHSELPMSRTVKERHKYLERQVLQAADEVIATSKTTAIELSQIRERKVHVITNGYDHLKYSQVEVPLDKNFTVSHIGSLLKDRNPKVLWAAFARLGEEVPGFREDFRLLLAGSVSLAVREQLTEYGLDDNTDYLGYVHHSKALRLQKASQCLLLIEIDRKETRGIIPGKLFEYLASRRPVLAIGPSQWEAGELLETEGHGKYFTYSEEKQVIDHLKGLYQAYKENRLEPGNSSVERYSRKAITAELAKII